MAKLMLYSPELRPFAPTVAGIWSVAASEQKEFESLDDMAKEIGKFQALDQLVVFTHGVGGGITLEDGNQWKLDDPQVAKALAKVSTRVDQIRFEGCWVGENPEKMAVFGHLLNAKYVSAYTWEHFFNDITVTLDKNMTAETVKKALDKQWRWLAPFPPVSAQQLASLGSQGKVQKILMTEWYQYAGDAKRTRPWEVQTIGNQSPHGYKLRSEASKVAVKEKDAAPLTDVPTPFEYITVEIQQASRTSKSP